MLTTAFTAFSAAYVRSGYCSAWYDVKCVPSAGVRSTSRSMYCTEPSRGAVTFQAVNPPAAADTATTPKIKNAFFIITNWFNKLIRGNFRHRLIKIFYFVGQTNENVRLVCGNTQKSGHPRRMSRSAVSRSVTARTLYGCNPPRRASPIRNTRTRVPLRGRSPRPSRPAYKDGCRNARRKP